MNLVDTNTDINSSTKNKFNSVEVEEISIDELGLSVRAHNAFRKANIYTLNELLEFLTTNNISDLKNVGSKTVKEIETLLENLRIGGIHLNRIKNERSETSEVPIFENISTDLNKLSIDALVELGLSNKLVSKFLKNGINDCGSMRSLSRKELSNIVGEKYLDKLREVATLLEKDIISLLDYVLEKHRKSREYNVFLRRAKGETLQGIAENPGREEDEVITRERVRQIERNYARSVTPFVRELFSILKGENGYLSIQDILDIYTDNEYGQILLAICNSFEEFEYLDFAELFVERANDSSVEQTILNFVLEIIGEGADLFEIREIIEGVLAEHKFDYISIEDIINLLKKQGYTIYGTFAVKRKSNYSIICMSLIKMLFPNGIKLSQSESEQSEDLRQLRQVVREKYEGIVLPPSDRTISSALTRNGLILRGRGTYISQEYVSIDESLLLEIKSYIDSKEANKIFYTEIFSKFEETLTVNCGIDNYNYLHGVLLMRFPDSYEYGRDYLLKNGISNVEADSISDRIYKYICNVGRPVSKEELAKEFKGFSNIMLIMPFINDERLMQWKYNFYTCSGILNITEIDIADLEGTILEMFEENSGYVSEDLLYERVQEKMPDFILKNKIKSAINLFYIVSKLFSATMDFRRPHIVRKNIGMIITTKNVILHLLDNPDSFTYEQCIEICDKMKWSRITFGAALYDVEDDYARISINGYLRKEQFSLPENIVNSIKGYIIDANNEGFLPLMSLEMDKLPKWENEWNEFVIETIIKKYYPDLLIIHPVTRDRRYQRGIIVKKSMALNSYSEIVAYKMKAVGCTRMTRSQFLSFLVAHKLARKVIPSELSNSDYVKKDGEYYVVVD